MATLFFSFHFFFPEEGRVRPSRSHVLASSGPEHLSLPLSAALPPPSSLLLAFLWTMILLSMALGKKTATQNCVGDVASGAATGCDCGGCSWETWICVKDLRWVPTKNIPPAGVMQMKRRLHLVTEGLEGLEECYQRRGCTCTDALVTFHVLEVNDDIVWLLKHRLSPSMEGLYAFHTVSAQRWSTVLFWGFFATAAWESVTCMSSVCCVHKMMWLEAWKSEMHHPAVEKKRDTITEIQS